MRKPHGTVTSLTFGELLRQKRHEARLTQEQLAQRSGLAARTISDLERGLVTAPRWDTVRLLAGGLGLQQADQARLEEAARNGVPASPRAASDEVDVVHSPARHTLPRDVGSFTGRVGELRELVKLVEAGGEVPGIHAIGGMAGVGKTALAVRAAHELAGRFPDGHFFLQLHGHTPGLRPMDPSDALASLLMTAGLPAQRIPPGLAARTSLWRDHLAGKRVLLLLDDAVSSDQVRPLLPGNRQSLVLLTSRRHLTALDDARTVSLAALAPAEAAELLVRLARRPGMDSGDDAVRKIVRLCGYLPLAVGMLARQLHHHPAWTCDRLAADLATARNRLDLMHAEDASVSAAFDLSYQDLSPAQRRLFWRLGLHPGPDIDAYAAAALDGTDPATAGLALEAIYDHYLLTEPAQGRYRMHDLIREHARAVAAQEDQGRDTDEAVGRLLDYYQYAAQAADRLMTRYVRPQAQLLAAAAVPAMTDDIQALSWAREERASLQACLDYAADTGLHSKVVGLTAAMAALLRNDGPWAEAIARHRRAIDAARHVGDQLGEGGALADLGDLLCASGDTSGALVAIQDALGLYDDIGDRLGRANTMTDLAALRANAGDAGGAVAAAQEAVSLYRDLGDRLGQARALSIIGFALCRDGESRHAVPALEDALAIYRDLGNRLGHASVLNYIAVAWRETGRLQAAAEALEVALAIHREIGNRPGQASVLVDMGSLRNQTGDYRRAAHALESAVDILREIGDLDLLSQAYNEMGTLHWARGEVTKSRTYHQHALDLASNIGSPWLQACAVAGLRRCAAITGEAS